MFILDSRLGRLKMTPKQLNIIYVCSLKKNSINKFKLKNYPNENCLAIDFLPNFDHDAN